MSHPSSDESAQQEQKRRSTATASTTANSSANASPQPARRTADKSHIDANTNADPQPKNQHQHQSNQTQSNRDPSYLLTFNPSGFPQTYAPGSYFAYVAEMRRRLGRDDAQAPSGFLHDPAADDWSLPYTGIRGI